MICMYHDHLSSILAEYPEFECRVINHSNKTKYLTFIVFWSDCPFLIDIEDNKKLCGIYKKRSFPCRSFPIVPDVGTSLMTRDKTQSLFITNECPRWQTITRDDYLNAIEYYEREDILFREHHDLSKFDKNVMIEDMLKFLSDQESKIKSGNCLYHHAKTYVELTNR